MNSSWTRALRPLRAHAAWLLIAATLAPTLGWAQQSLEDQALEQQGLTRAQSGWTGSLGLGLALAPKYPGANKDRLRPVPLISIDHDNRLFLGPFGIGVAAVRWNGFRAGPVLGFHGGRRQSDDPHLAGLGDISTSITAGLFAAYVTGPLEISATARQAVSHSTNGLSGLLQVTSAMSSLRSGRCSPSGPISSSAAVTSSAPGSVYPRRNRRRQGCPSTSLVPVSTGWDCTPA